MPVPSSSQSQNLFFCDPFKIIPLPHSWSPSFKDVPSLKFCMHVFLCHIKVKYPAQCNLLHFSSNMSMLLLVWLFQYMPISASECAHCLLNIHIHTFQIFTVTMRACVHV